jgi:hypothetical protein
MYKVLLINPKLGSLLVNNGDPIDINAISKNVKRSDENDGVVYEMMLDLKFIKDGRNFIKASYETAGGVDSEVVVNIYRRDVNRRKWKVYYVGQINFNKYDLSEEDVVVTIEQTGFTRSVLNLIETDVNLETSVSVKNIAIPATNTFNTKFHSKKILREFDGLVTDDTTTWPFNNDNIDSYIHIPFDTDSLIKDEVTERFTYPLLRSEFEPSSVSEYDWLISESGVYTFDFPELVANISADVPSGFSVLTWTFKWIFKYGRPGNYTEVEIASHTLPPTSAFQLLDSYNTTITLYPTDEVYIYGKLSIPATFETHTVTFRSLYPGAFGDIKGHLKVSGATTFRETNSKVIMLYEAFEKVCQYITNQTDCFRSNLLARTEIVVNGANPYSIDGDAGLIALTNGKNLRGAASPIFSSLRKLNEFVNMAFCAGIGFENIGDKQVVRYERKEYFFNKNQKILSLGKVYNIKKSADAKRYWNSFVTGYEGKLNIEKTNAIDEFNTLRKFNIPITNTKNILKVSTGTHASGFQIEEQRRLSTKTEDSNLDDENFVACVLRDGASFKTKKNEGYDSITNVYDAPTGYNYDISPARSVLNWKKYIASCLVRSEDKTIKFSSGEVNYLMTSKKPTDIFAVAENGNFDTTLEEPLWDPEIYSFEHGLSDDEMSLIEATPYGYIEFEDRFGEVMQGYILDVKHDAPKKDATFQLLKVYRKK